MSTAVIEANELRMQYGDKTVLAGVDLRIDRGEVVVLLGPNGAGKTTIIEILEGFRRPSAGVVRVLGADPLTATEAWRAGVGVVLQSWRDHAKWTPRELLHHFGGYYAAYSTAERQRPVPADELVERVRLGAAADQKIKTLSGGQRRRLDVAVGLVGRPEVLFLDEPTAGFDPQARRDFHELLHGLSDTEETTILMTTHDLSEAERLADRILILNGGQIVANGSPDHLAREVAGVTEVRWVHDGQRHVHATGDPTDFVRKLFASYDEGISDLEVRPTTLEDTYLSMVRTTEGAAR